MFWRSNTLKPLASTRTLYVPGERLGALYSPASFATRAFATPLSVSKTVTVAPAMTPPLWSVTVPRMRPKLAWENSEIENSNTPRITPSVEIAFPARAFSDLKKFITPPLQNREAKYHPGRAPPLGRYSTFLNGKVNKNITI